VIGGGHVGRALAERLAAHGPTHHLDADPDAVEAATAAPHAATHVDDVTAPDAIAALSPAAEDLAVVVTGHDGRNLLVAQHLRAAGAGRVLVVPTDPRNEDLFDLPDVATLSRASALAAAVRTHAALDGNVPEPTADPAGDRPGSE
jgi:Trk K+ transport system NAD-binding subunit